VPDLAVPKAPVHPLTVLVCVSAAAILGSSGCSGCQDPRDRAAKKRIFSPEDPPRVVASAQERLAAEQLGDDPRLAERVLTMGAAEMAERLGAHRFNASVAFDWSAPAATPVRLTEARLLEADSRGVNGDFHAKVDNNQDLGLEVVRVDGQVYARNRFGKFRLRRRDRGMAERTREDIVAPLKEIDALFDRRLKLVPQGTVAFEGRQAFRYEVVLASAAPPEVAPPVPPLLVPKGGVDETTRRRLGFWGAKKPRSMKGEVLVDQATGVVLRAVLDGRLDVPEVGPTRPAALRVTLEQKVTRIGQAPLLKVPAGALPDVDKPEGIADALDRFGIPRGGKTDAGVEDDDEG
jgi:hypothetical protein